MTDTYAYDGENRLVQLQKNIPGDNNITVGAYYYTYDYRTRRVLRTECTPGYEAEWGYQPGVQTDTEVIYSGGTSVQEYNLHDMPEGWEGGGMMMMTQTVTLPNPLMPLRFRWSTPDVEYIRGSDYGGGIGGILYTLRWDEPSYTHNNRRGDIIAKTDGTGSLTYQATYEAYGKRTQESGFTQDRQKANSKDEDPTGLLNEGFRYRDLDTGTFITRDPLGFVNGPNIYAYVVDNPWTHFDPEGLFAPGLIYAGYVAVESSPTWVPYVAYGGAAAVSATGAWAMSDRQSWSHERNGNVDDVAAPLKQGVSCTSGDTSAGKTDKNTLLKPSIPTGYTIPLGATKEDIAQFHEDRRNGDINAQNKLNDKVNQRFNGGKGSKDSPSGSAQTARYENPGHHDPSGGSNPYNASKSVLPANHEELWTHAQKASDGNYWTKEGNGKDATYHKFKNSGNDTWHWIGSTNSKTKSGQDRSIQDRFVPNDVKKRKGF